MSFEIAEYRSEYQNSVLDLWKKCGLIVPQNNPVEDIQKKIEYQPELFLIAFLDGHVIGSVMVGYEGHRGWLNYLAILPKNQKQGFGRNLVEGAINVLRRLGCLKVNVQVRKRNASAIGFYERLGFTNDNVVSLGLRLKR
ncbi:MAG: GNAT family acetyltransferase [Candidatus Bathyarchaeota archaeon]|nr:GNAT family acetyltransferase [Candidatus Bathyarchaeota archaeon]